MVGRLIAYIYVDDSLIECTLAFSSDLDGYKVEVGIEVFRNILNTCPVSHDVEGTDLPRWGE